MDLIFAKYVFTFAAVLAGGPGQDLPVMAQVTEPIPQVRQRIAAATVEWIPCPEVPPGVVAPPCVPTPSSPNGLQVFCTAPGVYTVTVRLGLLAFAGQVGGKVWVESGAERSLLAAWTAAPGSPAYVAGSLQVASPAAQTCYRVTVDATGPVEVVAEHGVSFVTVGR